MKNRMLGYCLAVFLTMAAGASNAGGVKPAVAAATPPAAPSGMVTMNFKNAPLGTVLGYLSKAAGYIALNPSGAEASVSVVALAPVTPDHALDLLDAALADAGLTLIRDGRRLTVVSREDARTLSIPIRTGSDPDQMPSGARMVTQIIPLTRATAAQVLENMRLFLPDSVVATSNAATNTIIITDSESTIHRTAEIARAFDQIPSATGAVRVYPLVHADAASAATLVGQLFAETGAASPTSVAVPVGFPGSNQDPSQGQSQDLATRMAQPKVIAAADERTNSLVVSAPMACLPEIEAVLRQIDHDSQAPVKTRIFKLVHADAQETADSIASLFVNQTAVAASGSTGSFGFGQLAAGAQTATSSSSAEPIRSVADIRTNSVIVSASEGMMAAIEAMIAKLDANPARTKGVYVMKLQSGSNGQAMAEKLQALFGANATGAVDVSKPAAAGAGSTSSASASSLGGRGSGGASASGGASSAR